MEKYFMVLSGIFVLLSTLFLVAEIAFYLNNDYENPGKYDEYFFMIESYFLFIPIVSVFLIVATILLYLFTMQKDINKLLNKKYEN